jgi:single-strand DNA-binding protein
MNVNRVILIGRLTRDPEIRSTPKGTAVTDIGLAVNRVYGTEGGEKKEESTFVEVRFWGRQAELASQYLKKGRAVFIEGRLQSEAWEQAGQKRTRLLVVSENMQFLGRSESQETTPTAVPAACQPSSTGRPQSLEDYEPGDEVPF